MARRVPGPLRQGAGRECGDTTGPTSNAATALPVPGRRGALRAPPAALHSLGVPAARLAPAPRQKTAQRLRGMKMSPGRLMIA